MSYKNDICEQASRIISGERQGQYGSPEDSFAIIAHLWNGYKGGNYFNSNDVAVMMALMKIARISNGVFKEDSYVDAIGYLAIAAELSKGCEEESKGKVKKSIDTFSIEIRPDGTVSFNPTQNNEVDCSDSCGIDIHGGDPESVDGNDSKDEVEVKEDCDHCFYHHDEFNLTENGCLIGNKPDFDETACKKFKNKASCLTCAHNDSELIQDEDGNLRVLCKLDEEYHYNTTPCKNWEDGQV